MTDAEKIAQLEDKIASLTEDLKFVNEDANRFQWLLNQTDWECSLGKNKSKVVFKWRHPDIKKGPSDLRWHIDWARSQPD